LLRASVVALVPGPLETRDALHSRGEAHVTEYTLGPPFSVRSPTRSASGRNSAANSAGGSGAQAGSLSVHHLTYRAKTADKTVSSPLARGRQASMNRATPVSLRGFLVPGWLSAETPKYHWTQSDSVGF
jgi:hypothetical protein